MSWRGATGFVLALCLGVGFVIAVVAVTSQHQETDEHVAALLDVLAGALVGCVATWIGSRDPARRVEDQPHADEEEPHT